MIAKPSVSEPGALPSSHGRPSSSHRPPALPVRLDGAGGAGRGAVDRPGRWPYAVGARPAARLGPAPASARSAAPEHMHRARRGLDREHLAVEPRVAGHGLVVTGSSTKVPGSPARPPPLSATLSRENQLEAVRPAPSRSTVSSTLSKVYSRTLASTSPRFSPILAGASVLRPLSPAPAAAPRRCSAGCRSGFPSRADRLPRSGQLRRQGSSRDGSRASSLTHKTIADIATGRRQA